MSQVLIITGFGPFAGVEKNPTQEIVEELKNDWHSITVDNGSIVSISYFIVEVSVDGCESLLTEISQRFPGSEITFVHLGVDARSTHIKLEEFAYNNMSFRVPDQRNYQPEGKPIYAALAFDLSLQTCWNIPALIRNATFQESDSAALEVEKHEINPSTDPGRFLCNYIYFRSMLFRSCASARSIFIHVPLFEHIAKPQQVQIIKKLAQEMVVNCSVYDRNQCVLIESSVETTESS
jgi:pyroglutamyl-peptidase